MSYNDNFVEFLDSLPNKPRIDYFDVLHVLNAAHVHYYERQYQYLYPNVPVYHSLPQGSTSGQVLTDVTHENRQFNQHPVSKVPLFVAPRKVEIDCSIDSLTDIIHLLDKHPYIADCEYNIDLKNLHKIRPELVQLNEMIGLSSLKTSILNQLIYFLQEPILCEKKRGYKHTVLCGPPGTGKTEIAKIIGKMYSKLGVLSVKTTIAKVDELIVNKKETFPFKKVTRSDLIAGYVGQTAIKTRDVIKECLGGCLFIDEAYSLGTSCDNDGFSKECIDTLCEAMSDHKDDLMVIIAGYEEELKSQFFSANPGLESRFVWKFTIDKYSPEEMRQILEKKVAEEGWTLEMDKKTQLNWIEKNKDDFKYYGRDMEQLLLHVKVVHSRRIYGKSRDLCKRITMDDLENGRKAFIEHQTNKKTKMSESMYGLYL